MTSSTLLLAPRLLPQESSLGAAAALPCTVRFTWPPPGHIVPFGRTVTPGWSTPGNIAENTASYLPCGALCFTLNEGEPVCQPPGSAAGFQLYDVLPGYQEMRLQFNSSEAEGSETWFHVSTASDFGNDDALRERALAHLVDIGHPASISQFDDPTQLAHSYLVDRFGVSSVSVASWRDLMDADVAQLLPAPEANRTGVDATAALAEYMQKELLLRELRSVARNAFPSGTFYPLQALFEGKLAKHDPDVILMILHSEVLKPDMELATTLLRMLQEASDKSPSFAMASRSQLEVAWLLKGVLEPAVAEFAIERAARAAYQSIISIGKPLPLRQRGDPRRPVGDIVLITVASHSTPELELMRRSAAALELELRVAGLGEPWLGLGSKIPQARRLLDGVNDNALVLFVDAFDTLFLPLPKGEITSRYLSIGADIVFGAEYCCAPDAGLAVLYPGHLAARGTFLNSGTFVGRAADVRAMLDQLLADMQQQQGLHGVDLNQEDDQRVFTRYFLRHRGGSGSYADGYAARCGAYGGDHVALDVRNALFLTLISRDREDIALLRPPPLLIEGKEGRGSDAVGVPLQPLLRFEPTGTTPFLLHGNAKSGRQLLKSLSEELSGLGWPPASVGGEEAALQACGSVDSNRSSSGSSGSGSGAGATAV